ncbi:pilus assembly protein PilA [Pseudoxanthomonas broegbernensis]|uniref:Pilus assembly protein PilA n=1 Tax=Pseudoxanthomonas broegbernensis TaxID=83619 RepID=A0A7V8GKL7_9GAMM|nr:GYF domain-containing protein [Pseudoxanthomonas broegbernensis]KAF1685231.1 pilus assembly protein PilA [Pseudoxanthomonas broegbernensis]MBB6066117.1 type IV pilus assembly protein PilA [Pseudoxanthomonas broegbernensis]
MHTWYYATADGQRHGPLPAENLRALAAAGTIGPRTLVWREGLGQWQPLHAFHAELGLDGLPPPLPAAAVSQPPRQGMSGCVIAVLVGVALLVLVPVVGILAAVALPAYHDYTLRAHAAQAFAQAQAQQPAVAAFAAGHGRCPENGDEGFGDAGDYAGTHLASIAFGNFDGGERCGLEAIIAAPGKGALDGKAIWLEHDPDTGLWQCSSNAADKHLPVTCRG